ncbi:MAG: dolichyl-phosphate beta-glucosyltransferase, partial [Patescibacteria group bacterium]
MSESIFLSVVIPAYNEEKRIGKTLVELRTFLDKQQYLYEVLIINDGSTDETHKIIDAVAQGWPQLKLVSNLVNRGKGAVVRQGVLSALGQYILFSDADNATPIDQIDKLLPYAEQYPVVIGSRHCTGAKIHIPQARHRIILSRLSNLIIRWLAVPGAYDTQCGFKLFQRDTAREIFERVTINRFGFDFEALAIAHHLGYSFKEVGVDWYNDGASKVRAGRDAIRTLWDLLKVRRNLNNEIYQKKIYDIKIMPVP